VLLGQSQPFRELALKDADPVNRVQSIPTMMAGAEYEVVEWLISESEICPPDDMAPLERTAARDSITARQLTVWG
jgi:hypothetical protein